MRGFPPVIILFLVVLGFLFLASALIEGSVPLDRLP